MKNIAEIDKNLAVETKIEREGLCFYDVCQDPFRIHGVFWENGMFRRIPEAVAKSVSEGVYNLHSNGAGGRVRFVTDSIFRGKCLTLPSVEVPALTCMPQICVPQMKKKIGIWEPSCHLWM